MMLPGIPTLRRYVTNTVDSNQFTKVSNKHTKDKVTDDKYLLTDKLQISGNVASNNRRPNTI